MRIQVNVEEDKATGKLLAVYYRLSDADVHRTVELTGNCLLDLDDLNRPVGLEFVGPFHLPEARKAASMYTSPALDAIFNLLSNQPNLVLA